MTDLTTVYIALREIEHEDSSTTLHIKKAFRHFEDAESYCREQNKKASKNECYLFYTLNIE